MQTDGFWIGVAVGAVVLAVLMAVLSSGQRQEPPQPQIVYVTPQHTNWGAALAFVLVVTLFVIVGLSMLMQRA